MGTDAIIENFDSIYKFLSETTLSSALSLVMSLAVIIVLSVEYLPGKHHPLQAIGDRMNKRTLDKVEELEKGQQRNERKLDEHIAQAYRSKILNFQSKLVKQGKSGHPQEEWLEVIDASDKYEAYVEENHIDNGKCQLAIEFIKESYKECLKNQDFANIVVFMK